MLWLWTYLGFKVAFRRKRTRRLFCFHLGVWRCFQRTMVIMTTYGVAARPSARFVAAYRGGAHEATTAAWARQSAIAIVSYSIRGQTFTSSLRAILTLKVSLMGISPLLFVVQHLSLLFSTFSLRVDA